MVNLRPLTEDDLEFLLEVRNNDSTIRFLENNSKFLETTNILPSNI